MRCPKGQYIGFVDGDRCRNCGYDFSLVQADAPLDLPMRQDEPAGPLADLGLRAPRRSVTPAARGRADSGGAAQSLRRSVTPAGFDLPLFEGGDEGDAPLVRTTLTPRPPLAVRRAAPTPRPRLEPVVQDEPALEFPEADTPAVEYRHGVAEPAVDGPHADGWTAVASAPARLAGAAIDALLLGGIDAGVLFLTLRLCGLELAEIGALPVVPMAAFLGLMNGGYLVIFTASGGRTIGKMLAGTRVVPGDGTARVSFASACVRAAACLLSILPAGLGFGMALVRPDGRALHDAIADTRVIHA
jgi:uncharacterized RDD family membrane protein YckC